MYISSDVFMYPIKLHINNAITPSVQRHRRISFHDRKKVEDELLRLEKT